MYKPFRFLFQKERVALFIILLIASILLLRKIGDPSLHHGDAPHHRMDGVFVLDFLRELPTQDIYKFAVNYYAQYPALAIGYRPPFFPFIEAIFNGIFGVNIWSSRLAILAFFIAGVSAWFKVVQRVFDINTAFWTSLLLVTTPFIAQWGWYTMVELPVLSMALLTAYVFYRFTETKRPCYLYATTILFVLTVYTKQTAVFLALWFLLYVVFKGELLNYIKLKEVWISIISILILITPLAVITIWLGEHNIAQSVGHWEEINLTSRLSFDKLKVYFLFLTRRQLTLPTLILSIIGIGWTAWKRDGRVLFFGLLIISTYIFFTFLAAKTVRYTIFWIPAFTLFATLPLNYLRKTKAFHMIAMIVIAIVACYQVSRVYARTPYHATGYDKAAKYILGLSKSPTVFFDGYGEAIFVYFMRAFDPNRSMYILRGRKILSSSVFHTRKALVVHANSTEDIREIFDKYGIEYITVESEYRAGVARIHQKLREFLNSGPFRLVKEIEIESNYPSTLGQKLKIYKYLNAKPITADFLEIKLPAVSLTIRAPIRRLKALEPASIKMSTEN